MKQKLQNNILSFLFLAVTAVLSPWWFTLVVAVAVIFLFDSYYQASFVGLLIDIVYGPQASFFSGIKFFLIFSALSAVIFIFKKRTVFSSE